MSGRSYDSWKRFIDIVLSAIGLAVTAPLQLVIAGLVRINLGSPILFHQNRPGKEEQIFELVKFRTMAHANPSRGLVTDEQRLTPFGSALRATSLDELPTLWNVLRGDMSLVGPRPLLVKYLDRYSARHRRRHEVRPGITGLAQVSGRNAIAWDEKLEHDIAYVDQRSLVLDLKILWLTALSTVRREGIAAEGHATMAEFMGSGIARD
jgi:lipopolysaccharide/colanic/teichoic acid biosynthesis glycosyltransferase